jgi:hypothetical protein
MSWYYGGYPAAFAAEGDPENGGFDPYIHGVNDTINHPDGTLDFKHA